MTPLSRHVTVEPSNVIASCNGRKAEVVYSYGTYFTTMWFLDIRTVPFIIVTINIINALLLLLCYYYYLYY